MADKKHRHALGTVEVAQEIQNLFLSRRVECRGGLVGDKQSRMSGKRHGDHHALTHAAAKIARIHVEASRGISNSHTLQQR